jgi:hypothetical protein
MPNLQDIKGVTIILVGEEDNGELAETICDILSKEGFKRAVDSRDSRRREMVFVKDSAKWDVSQSSRN